MARILVIDDDQDTRDLLRTLLRDAGHEVALAADGDEGVRAYRRERPDVVLVDIFMPHKDGLEVMAELRRDLGKAKIIAISAGWNIGRRDALRSAREVGADLTIRKPMHPDVVLKAVDGLLAGP